ncbi:hypothetical protein [Sphingomonas sp. ID1715]|uniref:hypothetical protein n=1 Tax=Sphingomonas sp. ID1715 TaxID=1656898 RepID=UPI001C2C724E|nr:hypothetical protein [Sphingomonas sp. ID1715]
MKRHATRVGLSAALAACVLWPIFSIRQSWLRWPFAVALTLTALSGLVILAVTVSDLLTIRRSRHARPARAFDLALGVVLAIPASLGLIDLLG